MIEKITRVALRKVWKHEAHDFTVWLTENIDVLSEIVGFEISNPEREQSTGNFNVDIKAEDQSGDVVVIENQLEKSDHDHLGKIITYLSSFDAKKAIWITKEARPEHINAINWLNEGSNGCDFWLLQVEAIQIGNSNPAPLITKIVGPSEEAKQVGKLKKEDSERHHLRLAFWTKFLDTAKGKLTLFNAINPSKDIWIGASAKAKGCQYCFWINKHSLRAELRIDIGKDSEAENLKIFHSLFANKEPIENKFGEPLIWDESEGNRVCIIKFVLEKGGYRNPSDEWEEISLEGINVMKKLDTALRPFLNKL